MADFNKNTAHEELITHALEKTSETGITETNKEKLKQTLEEKEGETLKIKIETKEELEKLKTNIVTKLKLKQAEGLTEAEIKETATEIIEESKTPETETNTETIDKTAPEVPEVEHNLPPLEKVAIPDIVQEEMAKYSPKPGNIGKFVQDFILNFMAGFAPDWVAKVRGFGNAALEKKADAGYNTLVGDEGRALLEGSPLSNILILDHIDKNNFKKILAEYPTLDFSNKTHIEAAFLGKHANNENLTKYHRIYQGMGEMQTELSNPESIGYNPEERFKRLLSYSRQEDMEIEKYEPAIPINPQQEQVPMDSSSPEVQKELMTQATELDEALTKARAMPEGTTEEKAVKEEAIKKAQEVVTKFKEERKNTILKEYNSIKDRIKEGDIEKNTLIQRNSPEESEKKKLDEVNNALIKLRTVENSMRIKIDEVMTQSGEKWEVKNEATTQSMTSVEIAIGTIENNTASIQNQEVSEEEKRNREKMVIDLEKEVSDILYGGSTDWRKNYQIDNPKDISALEKKISDIKQYTNTNTQKEKIVGMEKKIQIAKLKIEAVRAFLLHAKGLAAKEGEIPDYKNDSDDFIHLEANGLIDINTVKISDWSSIAFGDWADESWSLNSDDIKITQKLGGKQKFINVIKANVDGLKDNEGLFVPKKGGDKFTI